MMKNILKILVALMLVAVLFTSVACLGVTPPVDKPDNGTEGGTDGGDGDGIDSGGDSGGEVILPDIVPPTIMTKKMVKSKLISSPYADNVTTQANLGLGSIPDVGVKKDTAVHDVIPSDATFGDRIYRAVDHGISPDNEDNASAFDELMQTLRNVNGAKKVVLSAGTYRFSRTLTIKDVDDLYIVGKDTDMVFTNWCVGFDIEGCDNIHLSGFTVDYDPSSTVSGTIRSIDVDSATVSIQLYDEFNLTPERYDGGRIKYGNYMEYVVDPVTGDYIPDAHGNLKYNSTGDGIKSITGGSYDSANNVLTLTFKSIVSADVGKVVSVSFTMYEFFTVHAKSCEGMYLENIDFYHSCGMTFSTDSCGNIYLNDVNVALKSGSKRLQTATADGLHGIDCYGDYVVTNSLFEYSHDDSINICSFYKTVTDSNFKTITCSAAAIPYSFPIEAGDEIDIYDPKDFRLVASYKVEAVEVSMLVYTLTVDKVIKEDLTGYLVGDATRATKLRVENCIFRNKRNRGILAQVRNSVITNCAFVNVIHGAVSIHTAQDVFSEAILPKNVTVTNCKFISNNEARGLSADVDVFVNGKSGAAIGAIDGIIVTNNLFYGGHQSAVNMKGVGNSKVYENLFYDICRTYSSKGRNTAVRLQYCEGITVTGNFICFSEEHSDFEVVKGSNLGDNVTIDNNQVVKEE